MKEDSTKDLLEKNVATKITSIQKPEQGRYYQKIYLIANLNIFLIHVLVDFMLYVLFLFIYFNLHRSNWKSIKSSKSIVSTTIIAKRRFVQRLIAKEGDN